MHLVFLLFASFIGVIATPAREYSLREADQLFQDFQQQYEKQYIDEQEKEKRFEIFKENLMIVNLRNKGSGHAEFGITKFMDLTAEEFRNTYTGFLDAVGSDCQMLSDYDLSDLSDVNAPDSWDWRDHNAVSEVKDQKQCGSCYSFSSTGHLESQYAIKHKQILSLSEQQIVDCDTSEQGCNGGSPAHVFGYLMQNGGIERECDYPYVANQQPTCSFSKNKAVVQVTNCYLHNPSSQEQVKQLLYKKGPLSIGTESHALQTYTGGILTNCNGLRDHAVLLVGYGTDGSKPYWIVKNSWGTTFGEKGYYRMIRGEGANSCGLMAENNIFSADVA